MHLMPKRNYWLPMYRKYHQYAPLSEWPGWYLTLLCGYLASVARETPLLISNAHSRAGLVFNFAFRLPCKRGTRNPTPHFQCTFSRQSGSHQPEVGFNPVKTGNGRTSNHLASSHNPFVPKPDSSKYRPCAGIADSGIGPR